MNAPTLFVHSKQCVCGLSYFSLLCLVSASDVTPIAQGYEVEMLFVYRGDSHTASCCVLHVFSLHHSDTHARLSWINSCTTYCCIVLVSCVGAPAAYGEHVLCAEELLDYPRSRTRCLLRKFKESRNAYPKCRRR